MVYSAVFVRDKTRYNMYIVDIEPSPYGHFDYYYEEFYSEKHFLYMIPCQSTHTSNEDLHNAISTLSGLIVYNGGISIIDRIRRFQGILEKHKFQPLMIPLVTNGITINRNGSINTVKI